MLENGNGCPQNREEAFKLFALAAKERSPLAMFKIAMELKAETLGGNNQQDAREVVYRWLHLAAAENRGGPCARDAKYELGLCYLTGFGCTASNKHAFGWFHKASGTPEGPPLVIGGLPHSRGGVRLLGASATKAQLQLAKMYEDPARGPEQWGGAGGNAGLARYFRVAAAMNGVYAEKKGLVIYEEYTTAAFELGLTYLNKSRDELMKDANLVLGPRRMPPERGPEGTIGIGPLLGLWSKDELAYAWLLRAAKTGHREACFHVGCCCMDGTGVPHRAPSQALLWLTEAADKGLAIAMYVISGLFSRGEGVTANPQKASEWLVKAADRGHTQACYDLGIRYDRGNGVEKDPEAAFARFLQAEGHANAEWHVGLAYETGVGTAKDPVKAYQYYERSAWHGNHHATFDLGCCFALGNGVEKDYKQALVWFRKCAKKVVSKSYVLDRACYAIGLCYYNGTGVKRDLTQARPWFVKAQRHGHALAANMVRKCGPDESAA
jgi:TPR repeat protein